MHILEFRVNTETKETLLWDNHQLSVAELFESVTSAPEVFKKDDIIEMKSEIYEYFASFTSDQVDALKNS